MELHLKIVGLISIVLAGLHFVFPKYFNWNKELMGLSLINKQLMYVHTFFIALIVLLIGAVCLYSSNEIVESKLGQQLSFGLFIFWFVRLLFQFFVYSSTLWRGKLLETTIHVFFSLLWLYFSSVFFLIAVRDY